MNFKVVRNTFIGAVALSLCSVFQAIGAEEQSDSLEFEADSLSLVKDLVDVDSLSVDSLAGKPEERYDDIVFVPKTSVFHIPVDINIKLLEKKINEGFSGLLYEDANIEDDSLMIKAWKQKDFVINYENKELSYRIPLKLWIKKRIDLGITYTDREIEGSIDIQLRTKIGFSKTWDLITKTTIEGYEWIEKPVIKIAGLNVPITVFANSLINGNKDMFNRRIDEMIRQFVPLNGFAKEIWTMVQEPIDISAEGYKAWIRTTPEEFYTTPIVGNYGHITTTFGVKCKMSVFMGDVASANKTVNSTLPPFKMYTKTDERFCMNLVADIPYYVIDSIAKSTLVGMQLGEGRHSVTVDSLSVFGQDDKIVIGVRVSGFMNGDIYLKGVPYFEKETTSLRIKDVDYELDTRNILAKTVNLFYKKGLKRKLEEEFVFSLKDQFYLVKELSRSELFNAQLMENVAMNGFIDNLDVDGIYITARGLAIEVKLAGKMKLRVE